mgnify:CR=1 FL=1
MANGGSEDAGQGTGRTGAAGAEAAQAGPAGSAREVFAVFLKLGLTSFGGPIAHLGYFRDELVTRRRWLSEAAYADLVALCQFLPGPASSQVGFALGLLRAGPWGALAAFAAFTAPSALALIVVALTAAQATGPVATGALAGLKIVAVAIVAQAVLGMARNLCPDRERAAIAVGAVALLAAFPDAPGMIGAIVLGGLAGLALGRGAGSAGERLALSVPRGPALACLGAFFALLLALPLLAGAGQALAVIDAFYRAGALVFGGGHVVLPLLQAEVVAPGWVTEDAFLAGYGAAQAVPGPLFTFAAYLGTVLQPAPSGLAGAALALGAIFLPGFLLLVGVLPFWDAFRRRDRAQSAMQGANAAVVGILGAALYSPVFTSAVGGMADFALAAACFVALTGWRAPPWAVVLVAAAGGAALALAG